MDSEYKTQVFRPDSKCINLLSGLISTNYHNLILYQSRAGLKAHEETKVEEIRVSNPEKRYLNGGYLLSEENLKKQKKRNTKSTCKMKQLSYKWAILGNTSEFLHTILFVNTRTRGDDGNQYWRRQQETNVLCFIWSNWHLL